MGMGINLCVCDMLIGFELDISLKKMVELPSTLYTSRVRDNVEASK